MPVTGGVTTRYSRNGRNERLGAELLANVSKPVSTSMNVSCAFTCVTALAAGLVFRVVTDFCLVYRTSSQKPGDELYENFRQHFPAIAGAGIASTSTSSGDSNPAIPTLGDHGVDVASQERLVVLDFTVSDSVSVL